jgi:hypothetical protein
MQLGHVEVHVRSDEESGAETKEDDEIEGGFMTERKEPVPKWELLAEKRNGTSRTPNAQTAQQGCGCVGAVLQATSNCGWELVVLASRGSNAARGALLRRRPAVASSC